MHVFLSYLLLLYIGRVHGAISGCTVLGEVHPVSAQNKSLISDTGVHISSTTLYRRLQCIFDNCLGIPMGDNLYVYSNMASDYDRPKSNVDLHLRAIITSPPKTHTIVACMNGTIFQLVYIFVTK